MGELEELHASILTRLRSIVAAAEELAPAQLNAMPEVEGTNSPYVLATHALGNARAWVLGIACEQDIARDRPGEFASSGPTAEALRASLTRLESESRRRSRAGSTSADGSRRGRTSGGRTPPARSPCGAR